MALLRLTLWLQLLNGSLTFADPFIPNVWLNNFLLKSGRLGQVLVPHLIDDGAEAQNILNQLVVISGKKLNT